MLVSSQSMLLILKKMGKANGYEVATGWNGISVALLLNFLAFYKLIRQF